MRFSQFNVLVPDSDYYVLYNILNRALARIPQSAYTLANKDLKKSGFIIEDEEDESLIYLNFYLKSLFENDKPTITITTTQKCNLSCYYCFEGSNKSNESLSIETCDATEKQFPITDIGNVVGGTFQIPGNMGREQNAVFPVFNIFRQDMKKFIP